ncbi:MAG: hypothetical protein FJ291_03395 [Planctomycetes bacterium]|nr:hypothetical protein [Planctomycetota bacterium]
MTSYTRLWVCALGAMAVTAAAAERVFPLNLATQREATDKVQVQEVGKDEYEWSLPDGLPQNLSFDLRKLGADPKEYDELRFDLKPLGSQVRLHAVLFGMPTEKELSSWYSKFRSVTGVWAAGRFDLRVDDDGSQYPERFGDFRPGILRLALSRRILGFPGEPQWRKAIIRNPRLVKRVVSAEFEPRDVQFVSDAAEVAYTYGLKVKNRTDKPIAAKLDIDADRTLHFFRAEVPAGPAASASIALAAGEEKVIPIRLSISRTKAMSLPPGYSEPVCPRVWVEGLADSDVQPLIGYRRMLMWGVVPVSRQPWTPASFQARVAAAAKFMPLDAWKSGVIRTAEETLKHDWPAFDWLTPGHKATAVPHWGQSYRCPACKQWMRSDPPNDIHRHVCSDPKCGKTIEKDPFYDQCARQEYFARRFADIRNLALGWLLTGDEKYAGKAVTIALAYADAHPTMTVAGYRSTGGGSRLGKATLVTAWNLHKLAEGYAMLASYAGLDEHKRKRIDTLLIDEGLRLARHSIEYTNMQGEHIRAYGSVGLATGYWPLLGEAVYGEFGWHEMVEYGFSEEGLAHEGQAYHNMLFDAMSHFALFASERGVDLMTPRFKRVYDGSLTLGLGGAFYELPYRQYRDPAYLAALEAARKHPSEISILHGELGLASPASFPAISRLMDGMGYIFLRRGTAADSWEIRMNYKEQFDRGEHDRFTTFLYRNGQQVDSTVGRMFYTVPGAGWMEWTAAHNTIVIDGQNSREVTGDLVAWRGAGETPFAVVATDPAAPLYEGVSQLRGIALLGEAYVVFDRVVCDRPLTIDRYQYGKGKATLGLKAEPLAAAPPKLPAAGRFTEIIGGACGKELRVDFGNALKMRLACDQEMAGYKALTFKGDGPIEVTWARADNAKEATFLATFTLGKDTEPPAAKIIKSTDDEVMLDVKAKDRGWTLTVHPKQRRAEVMAR